jgi:hypothetical protein
VLGTVTLDVPLNKFAPLITLELPPLTAKSTRTICVEGIVLALPPITFRITYTLYTPDAVPAGGWDCNVPLLTEYSEGPVVTGPGITTPTPPALNVSITRVQYAVAPAATTGSPRMLFKSSVELVV